MKNVLYLLMAFGLLTSGNRAAQTLLWESLVDDTVNNFSSPRGVELTGDGVLDIVVGGGVEPAPSAYGVTAFDGATGDELWHVPARNQMFGSPNFLDVTGDGVPDVFIGGREAQFYAINGATGALIWEFYSDEDLAITHPSDLGYWNF